MVRWLLAPVLAALVATGCDLPLEGTREAAPEVDSNADASADASEGDAYYQPPAHVDAGVTAIDDDATSPLATDAGTGDADARARDASEDAGGDDGDQGGDPGGRGPGK
jgi:hypothetical protein